MPSGLISSITSTIRYGGGPRNSEKHNGLGVTFRSVALLQEIRPGARRRIPGDMDSRAARLLFETSRPPRQSCAQCTAPPRVCAFERRTIQRALIWARAFRWARVISSSDFCSATSQRSAITSPCPLSAARFVHGDDVGQAGTTARPVQSALERQVRYGGRLDRHSVSRSMYPETWAIPLFLFAGTRSHAAPIHLSAPLPSNRWPAC